MKLAAIYNLWDGEELLTGSMDQIKDHVDLFIIVWQDISNFGEAYNPLSNLDLSGYNVILEKYNPKSRKGFSNEAEKRQKGLEVAKREGCTHFLHLDCDEYYEDFGAAKEQYIHRGYKGSVCKIYTYFKDPTFRLDTEDGYFVPFIHELHPNTVTAVRNYPYYVDPTRRINQSDVCKLDVYMHHFSWIRKNIERKVNNSTANSNIKKGSLMKDYYSHNLETNPDGYYIRDFDRRVKLVPDRFNISEKVKGI